MIVLLLILSVSFCLSMLIPLPKFCFCIFILEIYHCDNAIGLFNHIVDLRLHVTFQFLQQSKL